MSGAERHVVTGTTPPKHEGGEREYFTAIVVLASDYDRDTQALRVERDAMHHEKALALYDLQRCKAERDELRAQVEVMRALLTDARRYVDKAWPDGVHSYRANSVSGDLLRKIDAALQAKP